MRETYRKKYSLSINMKKLYRKRRGYMQSQKMTETVDDSLDEECKGNWFTYILFPELEGALAELANIRSNDNND